jgi:MATE family multidrug resistance protein
MAELTLPDSARDWHRRVWQLSWPVIAANVTIPLVGLADTAVMGRMPEAAFVGAVAVGATVFNALYWVFGFLRMGTTGLTAQALGSGAREELIAVAARGALLAMVIGTAAVALQLPLNALVLSVFHASPAVETLAGRYFLIRIWGAPALLMHMVVLGVLFGMQRMRATLALSVLLNATNVALDVIFVLGFGWGVTGVAAATVVSEWLAATAGMLVVARALGVRLARGRPALDRARLLDRERLANLFQVSGNLIVRSLFVQLPFFVFTLIGASLGDLVLAANAIVMQLFLTMGYALDGPAQTAESLCGYAWGARDRTGLRRAAGYSLFWAVLFAAALSLLIAAAGPTFVRWLTLLPDVRAAATALLPWAVAGPMLAVWAFHLDGVFIGTTRTATLRNCMFAAASLYLLVVWAGLEALGNTALWLGMMVFMGARGLLLGACYPRLEAMLGEPTR